MGRRSLNPLIVALVGVIACANFFGKHSKHTDLEVSVDQPRPSHVWGYALLVSFGFSSFVFREAWGTLPPWAKLMLRKYTPLGRIDRARDRAREKISDLKIQQRLTAFVGKRRALKEEAGFHSGRRVSDAQTVANLLVETRDAFLELWEEIVMTDGVRPGMFELVAFLRLLYQIRGHRAIVRDARYLESETAVQVESPGKMIKEKGIDDALDFADWAYLVSDQPLLKSKLKGKGYDLLRSDFNPGLGNASFYVATGQKKSVVYIAIKGSDTSADFLANFCCRSTPYNLSGPFVEGGTSMLWSHEGHSLVAQKLVDEIEFLVRKFLLPCGYSIIFVGHSLGGSLACAAGMILRSRLAKEKLGKKSYPEILSDGGRIVKVIAFAPAPFVHEDAAMMCKPFITSVINNSDVVPRCSMQNFAMWTTFLKTVWGKLDELGARPSLRSWGLSKWRKYAQLLGSDYPFMTMKEVKAGMAFSYLEIAKHKCMDEVFVPGKVLVMYDLWSEPEYDPAAVLQSKPGIRTAERMLLSDGKEMVMIYLEFAPRMFHDHTTGCYYSSVEALLAAEAEGRQGSSSMSASSDVEVSKETEVGTRNVSWSEDEGAMQFSGKRMSAGELSMGYVSMQSMEELGLRKRGSFDTEAKNSVCDFGLGVDNSKNAWSSLSSVTENDPNYSRATSYGDLPIDEFVSQKSLRDLGLSPQDAKPYT